MKLDVFAGREMAPAGRILVGDASEDAELRRLQHPGGNLYAQHLYARLPLAVGTVLQAERPELLFGDFAAAELVDGLFKPRDLRLNRLAAVPFLDLSGCSDGHKTSPPNLFLNVLHETSPENEKARLPIFLASGLRNSMITLG
jgi:hypothetical protein